MTDDTPDGAAATADAVREAIAAAEVGGEVLFDDLIGLGGVGEILVREGTAAVELSLPLPHEGLRGNLAAAVQEAARGVAGVDAVQVSVRASAADSGRRIDILPDVKNVVAVASGKGGVGKSTVAANLAVALADAGAEVGLMDADVYGPNAPQLLGLSDRTPQADLGDTMVPREAHGVRVMSMGFIAGEDDPVIWRGPIVDEFVKQLFDDVAWGQLDYLVVDLPPGTGDVQLSLVQHLPVAGAVIVTTPQGVAVDDAARGLTGFARYGVPVLGIVENMTTFACPDCDTVTDIFGTGGGDALAEEFEVPVLGRVPIDPAAGRLDTGEEPSTPGVSIPGLGRLQLPRTREERERGGRLPPIVLRDGGGETRDRLRRTATRVAARVNQAATQLE